MTLFSVAVLVFAIAVAIVNKTEPVLLSQSLTSNTAQARLTEPAVAVTVQDNRTSPNAADVWKDPNVITELVSAGETVSAAINPGVISIGKLAEVEGVVPSGNTNNSATLPPATKVGITPANQTINN